MRTKIKLTSEQVEMLIAREEKMLRDKFEKDLSQLKRKYETVEIDFNESVKPGKKEKISDETFLKYLNQKMSVKKIAEITGYNEGYIYRIKKRLVPENTTTESPA